jgi:hypothetical protein
MGKRVKSDKKVISNNDQAGHEDKSAITDTEKTELASELVIANEDKAELVVELVIANEEKADRAAEFVIANIEKAKRSAEFVVTSKELVIAKEKERLLTELTVINKQLYLQINERKLAEEDLHHSLAFRDILIGTIPLGMQIVDESGTVLFQSIILKKSLVRVQSGKNAGNYTMMIKNNAAIVL